MKLEIEKNIPIPPVGPPKPNAALTDTLRALEVGDSFFYTVADEARLNGAIKIVRSIANQLKIYVSIRRLVAVSPSGSVSFGFRVWRTNGKGEIE